MRGIEYFRQLLESKRLGVLLRYGYYEMHQQVLDFGISTPPKLQHWQSVVGWGAKAVDTLADRLTWGRFKNDLFDLDGIYNMNNPDVVFDSAILSALISGCSFIYISPDGDGFPRLQVIDGANATGEVDPLTGLLTEGYAVLSRDDQNRPLVEAYFLPNTTTIYEKGKDGMVYSHSVGYPLLVPIIHRPDAARPFGHARISRAVMNLIGSAMRTLKRGEISAEFYSFPQKYVSGLAEDAELDKWSAAMSAMITITKDADGDHPIFGQFQQQTMTPHLDQLRMFASMIAGETGLTLDDLGFPSDTPSSAESIKAAHDNLRLAARKAQRCFGSGFLNAGFLAACLRDKQAYERSELYRTRPVWQPIFEPDAAAISLIGDGVIKLNNAIPGYITQERLDELLGFDGGDD